MKTAKYFTATWCGPCKTFKPIVIELIEDGYSIEIIDLDEQQDIAVKYRISSVPTMIIEENGIEVDRFIGLGARKVADFNEHSWAWTVLLDPEGNEFRVEQPIDASMA